MADRPADRRAVRDVLKAVLNAVTNLQPTNELEESRRAEYSSVSDEVNVGIQIPRGRGRRIATATPSTVVSAASFNPRQSNSAPLIAKDQKVSQKRRWKKPTLRVLK